MAIIRKKVAKKRTGTETGTRSRKMLGYCSNRDRLKFFKNNRTSGRKEGKGNSIRKGVQLGKGGYEVTPRIWTGGGGGIQEGGTWRETRALEGGWIDGK